MSDYIVSSGEVANTITVGYNYNNYYNPAYDNMYISSGGTANYTTVNNYGCGIYVSNGGTANYTTVDYGFLYVSKGGVANRTTVNRGHMYVYSGGTANDTMVDYSGELVVHSGGTANFTFNPFRTQEESIVSKSGAKITYFERDAKVYIGNETIGVVSKADVMNSRILSSGLVGIVYSGGTANNITINDGHMYVYSGGVMKNPVVSSDGSLYVLSGGTATNIAWTPFKGRVDVEGEAYVTFANSISGVYYGYGGMMGDESRLISRAQSMNSKTVAEYSSMYVMSGGTVNNTTVREEGSIFVYAGGTANNTSQSGICGNMYIFSGGKANIVTISNKARLEVGAGGVANNVTVKNNGRFWIDSGGTATNISWTPCIGRVHWDVGAKVTFTKAVTGVYLESGDKVSRATTLSSKTLEDYTICVMSGGKASKITLDESDLEVYSGGTATDIYANGYSELSINCGGIAKNVKCEEGVDIDVNNGGIASNVTISGVGCLTIENGGVVSGLTISRLSYDDGFEPWGYYRVFSGGKITGRTRFLNGAKINVESGAIVDFDLTIMKSAGDSVLTNNLSAFREDESELSMDEYGNSYPLKPGAVYTLTVNGNQANGTYKLAGGASGFNKTISVVNTSGSKLGSLKVGSSVTISGKTYQLNLSGSSLTVTVGGKSTGGGTTTVDKTAPTVTNVKANTTAATNKDVTVTATFSDNVAVSKKLYKVGNGSWKSYSNGVTVSKNDTVSFKAVDTSGNESKVVSYKVTNIDKTAPAKPSSVKANITKTTNQAVTVTASFSKDSSKKQYSLDNKSWSTYSNGAKLTKNGTVYFRGLDAAGNISPVVSYKVTNIDTTPPTKPTAKANITKTTDQAVTVTASFSKDSSKKQYSLDNKKWSTYSNGVKLTKNGTVYFRGIDAAGNISAVTTYKVSNIQSSAKTSGKSVASVKNADAIIFAASEQPAVSNNTGAEWEMLATGDFNADGKDDTLWRNSFVGDDGSWYSAYCTKLASEENDWRMVGVANAEEWNFLGSGDFDGDGAADIAMISSEGIVCIWGVQDGGLSSWSILSAVTSEWSFSGIADFNADGTDDIAWSNPETGLAGFWQIENRELASWANLAVVS